MTSFIGEIDAFLGRHDLNERKLGLLALNDPKFVASVRSGERSPTLKTVEKVRHFMATYRSAKAAA